MSTAVVPISSGVQPDIVTQIRNEYQTRLLVTQAIAQVEQARATLAGNTVAKWASDSAAKGAVDPAATVTADSAWKQADDTMAAQLVAMKHLESLLEEQIKAYKKSNPGEVVEVLDEQIRALSAVRQTQEKAERSTESLLKSLLTEKSQLTGTPGRRTK